MTGQDVDSRPQYKNNKVMFVAYNQTLNQYQCDTEQRSRTQAVQFLYLLHTGIRETQFPSHN